QTKLAIVMTGRRALPSWQESDTAVYDFFDLKGVLQSMLAGLHVDVSYEVANHPSYRPGRTARLLIAGQQIGIMGELHPLVVERLDVQVDAEQAVLAADIDVAALLPHIPPFYAYSPISPYPPIEEDLAIVVDKTVSATAVEAVIRQAGGQLLKDVALF